MVADDPTALKTGPDLNFYQSIIIYDDGEGNIVLNNQLVINHWQHSATELGSTSLERFYLNELLHNARPTPQANNSLYTQRIIALSLKQYATLMYIGNINSYTQDPVNAHRIQFYVRHWIR